jgi:formylglycine-generating enzyme required for sulfatase activity
MRRLATLITAASLGLVLLAPDPALARQALPPAGMVAVESGEYAALYRAPGEDDTVVVESFYMDQDPVTNAQFLEFVRANPKWQRSRVSALFADVAYLRQWDADESLGQAKPRQPVTNVSWFAAKAYARWRGNRLPTVAEWEWVAGASQTRALGREDPRFTRNILALTSRPTPSTLPLVGASEANFWGVRDMHGVVWEWVSDFNSALVTGESRGDSGLERKLFCGAGVIGASDFLDYAAFMRFSFRGSLSAKYSGTNLGFRTVRSISPT